MITSCLQVDFFFSSFFTFLKYSHRENSYKNNYHNFYFAQTLLFIFADAWLMPIFTQNEIRTTFKNALD